MSNFEKNTVLLILSSEFYDEKEYIRDYNVFKKILKNKYLK
jgi:hypothetical protein